MTTSSEMSRRHFAARSGRAAAAAFVVACLTFLAASPGWGKEAFRLRLVREAADVEAAAGGGSCVRGQLYLVREFSAGAGGRGVWTADTLEASLALPPGVHAGVAREDAERGWHIELSEPGAVLRADPGAGGGVGAADIRLGRRDASAAAAVACDPARERLSDGAPILRRLRDAYASPGNERPVEVLVEP